MQKFKDWKEFINRILIDSGQFEKSTIESGESIDTENYKSTDKNSLTEIRVSYFAKENKLLKVHIYNPTIPGYNKYVYGEYFYKYHFSEPALQFNERNRNGVLSILKSGLKGKEVQFVKNNKILKSKLYVSEFHSNFGYSYYFTKRSFWNKIFGQKIEKMNRIEKREIELNTIFNGIKSVYKCQ